MMRKDLGFCLVTPDIAHPDDLIPFDPNVSLEPGVAGAVYYLAILDDNII